MGCFLLRRFGGGWISSFFFFSITKFLKTGASTLRPVKAKTAITGFCFSLSLFGPRPSLAIPFLRVRETGRRRQNNFRLLASKNMNLSPPIILNCTCLASNLFFSSIVKRTLCRQKSHENTVKFDGNVTKYTERVQSLFV